MRKPCAVVVGEYLLKDGFYYAIIVPINMYRDEDELADRWFNHRDFRDTNFIALCPTLKAAEELYPIANRWDCTPETIKPYGYRIITREDVKNENK